jgi:hypothetical protein
MDHTTHLHHYAIAPFLIISNPCKLFSNDVSHIPIGGDLIVLSNILMVENQIVCLTIEVIHLAKSPNGKFNPTLIFTLQDVSSNLRRAQFEQCPIPQTFFESCGTFKDYLFTLPCSKVMGQFGTPNPQSENPFESVGTYSLALPHICESVIEF